MPPQSPPLPPKPEVALALLQTASSVYIHLDPRGQDVAVPAWFKKQPQLVLQVGLNMVVPIPDLDVGRDALSCTLSFNRRPEHCRIPWSAIYGLVGEDGRGMIWPDSVPAEVAAAAEGRPPVAAAPKAKHPKLRLAAAAPTKQETGAGPTEQEPTAAGPSAKQAAPNQAKRGKGDARRSRRPPEPPTTAVSSQTEDEKKQRQRPPYLRVVK